MNSKLLKPQLYDLGTYTPPLEGRSSDQLLLDFNERTLPVSQPILKALHEFIDSGNLQKYPSYGDIQQKIADYAQVEKTKIMITNGSDQGIDIIIRACVSEGDEAIIPKPSFAMYKQCAKVQGANVLEPAYNRETGFPLQQVLNAVTGNTKLIVVPLPNNPCGTIVAVDSVERILQAAPNAVVMVDECYFEYCKTTTSSLLNTYSNLFITRTFSKTWGLSSLRLGFIMAQPQQIEQLLKIRGPYDVNQLAVVAIKAALSNPSYTDNYVHEIINQAKPHLEDWLDQQGIDYWPSSANYIWAFPENPKEIEQHLRAHNVLVRVKQDLDGRYGLRMTIGTMQQCQQLTRLLAEFYKK